MKKFLFILLMSSLLVSTGCMGGDEQPLDSQSEAEATSEGSEAEAEKKSDETEDTKTEVDANEEAAIIKVIEDNLDMAEKEDLDGYMATIDTNSPAFEPTKKIMQDLFDSYDIDYELESVKVKAIDGDNAQVEAVQITKKLDGPEFNDNKSVLIHQMVKTDEGWKVTGTQIQKTEAL